MCIRDRLIIDGKRVENDYTFVADDEEMKVEISYTFNASALGGKNLVTFEELQPAEISVEKLIKNVQIEYLKTIKAVSYTHLDVYKRQYIFFLHIA